MQGEEVKKMKNNHTRYWASIIVISVSFALTLLINTFCLRGYVYEGFNLDAFPNLMLNLTLLVYFCSKVFESRNESNQKNTQANIITSKDAITELRFLEFQLEKNYISEEEYQEKRAEFLMNIAKN